MAQVNRCVQSRDHEQARWIVFAALAGLKVLQVAFERKLLPRATFQYQIEAEVGLDLVEAKLPLCGGWCELLLKLGLSLLSREQRTPDTELVLLLADFKSDPPLHKAFVAPLQVERPLEQCLQH